jgi:hypothetical protein
VTLEALLAVFPREAARNCADYANGTSGLSMRRNRVIETSWGASMVSTAGLIHLAAPGSIPERSSRGG